MAEVITECECGQLEPLQLGCEACGAEIGEECRPMCIGRAVHDDAQQYRYQVEVQRSISVTVTVAADSAEDALDRVNRADFELPPRDEWSGHKDWAYTVYDTEGNELCGTE